MRPIYVYVHEHPQPSPAIGINVDGWAPAVGDLFDEVEFTTRGVELGERIKVSGIVSQVVWRGDFECHVTLSNMRITKHE